MKYYETLGKILKRLRQKIELSIIDVEDLSGKKVDRGYLSRIESGKIPPSEEILELLLKLYKANEEYYQSTEILMKASKQKIDCKFIPKPKLELLAEKTLIDIFGHDIEFPINQKKIAELLGYSIEYKDLTELFDEDFYGLLISQDHEYFNFTKSIIINNKNDQYSKKMQRMSIAHELSHIILNHKDKNGSSPLLSRQNQDYENYEWQANYLAGAILMPEKAINYIINKIKKENTDIIDNKTIHIDKQYNNVNIAKYLMGVFDVSLRALEVRLDQLSYNLIYDDVPDKIQLIKL